jgi:hypothetical protein
MILGMLSRVQNCQFVQMPDQGVGGFKSPQLQRSSKAL